MLDSEGLQIVPFEYDSVRIVLPFVIIGKKMSLRNNGEKLLLGAYSIKSKKILVPIEYVGLTLKVIVWKMVNAFTWKQQKMYLLRFVMN